MGIPKHIRDMDRDRLEQFAADLEAKSRRDDQTIGDWERQGARMAERGQRLTRRLRAIEDAAREEVERA